MLTFWYWICISHLVLMRMQKSVSWGFFKSKIIIKNLSNWTFGHLGDWYGCFLFIFKQKIIIILPEISVYWILVHKVLAQVHQSRMYGCGEFVARFILIIFTKSSLFYKHIQLCSPSNVLPTRSALEVHSWYLGYHYTAWTEFSLKSLAYSTVQRLKMEQLFILVYLASKGSELG